MSRFGISLAITNLILILIFGFNNIALGQSCKTSMKVSDGGVEGEYRSGVYDACNRNFDVRIDYEHGVPPSEHRFGSISVSIDNTDYSKSYWCGNWGPNDSPIIDEKRSCSSTSNHELVLQCTETTMFNGFYDVDVEVKYYAVPAQ